ncbi:MFS transporter [Promethearchaeum syntrophicum]|uniref:MFS transporter n=1 Tax=Promethearchaeum syntrophicum TaxID=2594042 RepID=A0A5B9DC39_9ARCH|nr:MFS transporter [Candidatus Prometheoarchaeum syntrophicum]
MEQKRKKRKQKTVFILPFIGDFSNSVLTFLFVVIGVNYGFSPIQIGWILSAYGITYVVMPAVIGRISDKINHKISLIISVVGQILLAIFLLIIFSFFSSPSSHSLVFYSIFIEQLLRGIFFSFYWPVIEAYLSEMGEHSFKAHKESINNFCISWGLGMAIGPFIGGIFSDIDIIFGFWTVLFSHIIALVIVLTEIKKPTKKNIDFQKSGNSEDIAYFNDSEKIPREINGTKVNLKQINIFLFSIAFIYALESKLIGSYFPNYALLSDGLGLSEPLTGELMLIYGIGQIIFYFIGRFFKNSFKALLSSILILSCLLILLFWVRNLIVIGVILFFTGLILGRLYYISLELLMMYEKKEKGKKAGIFESLIGLGGIISPLVTGLLAESMLNLPFLVHGIFIVAVFIILLIFKRTF